MSKILLTVNTMYLQCFYPTIRCLYSTYVTIEIRLKIQTTFEIIFTRILDISVRNHISFHAFTPASPGARTDFFYYVYLKHPRKSKNKPEYAPAASYMIRRSMNDTLNFLIRGHKKEFSKVKKKPTPVIVKNLITFRRHIFRNSKLYICICANKQGPRQKLNRFHSLLYFVRRLLKTVDLYDLKINRK